MLKRLSKHYLDMSKVTQYFTVLEIREWLDYTTKQPKGVVFEVFIRDGEEGVLLSVKIANKTLAECEKFKSKNVNFTNMFVVPWVQNGSTFVNFSYQADDIVGV